MHRVIQAVLRRPLPVLAATGLVALAGAWGLVALESDNSPQVFFRRDSANVQTLRDFERDFGAAEVSRVLLRGADLWTGDGVRYTDELTRSLREVPGVRTVLSPLDAGTSSAARTWQSAREDPLAQGLGLVSPVAATPAASLLVLSEPTDARTRDMMLARVEGLLSQPPPGIDVQAVGMPYLARAFDASSAEIGTLWFPILVGVSSLLLAFLFRGWRWVVAPLTFVGVCELVTLGVAGAAGVRLNLVLAILPPLLFVIALATAIHLATRVRALRAERDANASTLGAYAEKGPAILWTSLSAGVGFGSLAFTPVGPVADLGRLAALGLLAMAVFAFTLLPLLMRWAAVPPVPGRGEEALGSLGAGVATRAASHIRPVLFAVSGVALLAALGIPRLRVENDSLRYLAEDHPVRRAFAAAESAGIGVSAIELWLHAPARQGFGDGAAIQRLAWSSLRIREDLAEAGETTLLSVSGAGELVESTLRSSPRALEAVGGSAPREAALAALRESADGRRALASVLSADGLRARLTLFVRSGGYEEFDRVVAAATAILEEEMPGVEVRPTGAYGLLLDTQESLLGTLARSLALTFAGIAAILYLLLRRVRLTLLALVPNVLPTWLILGLMGWLGVPLDMATVMVASTTLGLALDDTLHTLVPFRRHVGQKGSFESLLHAVEKNAAAYSASGLVLGLGFAVCALSSFAPVRRFGALSALAIGLAVLADFLLVPALLGGLPAHWVVRGPDRGRAHRGGCTQGPAPTKEDPKDPS